MRERVVMNNNIDEIHYWIRRWVVQNEGVVTTGYNKSIAWRVVNNSIAIIEN